MARGLASFFGSWLMYVFASMLVLAAIAGTQLTYQNQHDKIAPAKVSNEWCQNDGGTKSAYEYPWMKGVYFITCNDGTQLRGD